jgi:SAM-dependent methyltransferase
METAKTRRVDSKGSLDLVQLEGTTLRIEGWAASHGGGGLTAVRVSARGMPCELLEANLHIPSPDVQAAFHSLDDSNRCRFALRASLPEGGVEPRDLLTSVEPEFVQGNGRLLWNMAASSLPDPPDRFITFVGSGFREVALEFLDYFVDRGGLSPTDDVLDVGCGVGRMAYGLVNYLRPTSRYEGFDIVPDLIDWAGREISSRHPNFKFSQAPIYNSHYNPGGSLKPSEYVFPYPADDFDFVFLTSVFTHMPGDVVRHYLDEIRRVLRPGGRAVITCFLINEESRRLIQAGASRLDLVHPHGDGMVAYPENPDYAIGFDEARFGAWLRDRGLTVVETLYGSWCGRGSFSSYQDILIVQG